MVLQPFPRPFDERGIWVKRLQFGFDGSLLKNGMIVYVLENGGWVGKNDYSRPFRTSSTGTDVAGWYHQCPGDDQHIQRIHSTTHHQPPKTVAAVVIAPTTYGSTTVQKKKISSKPALGTYRTASVAPIDMNQRKTGLTNQAGLTAGDMCPPVESIYIPGHSCRWCQGCLVSLALSRSNFKFR